MVGDFRRCPDCGHRLSSEELLDGLCPKCLLGLAQEDSEVVASKLPTLDFQQNPTLAFGEGEDPEGVTFSPGQLLGERYRIESLLGRGGMGEVWRAYDLKLRLEVALKSLHPKLFETEDARELLRDEVRAAREVTSPNVCRLFDLLEVGDRELVSMEYIDGVTLLKHLKQHGPLELREANEIASQLLAGLEAVHEAGLVHRDIKPENVMLTRAGRVVLMDFGLTSPTGSGSIGGTPAYMAPEQARGEATDARADVFSAGMVLAEMLSAERGPDESSRQTFWKQIRREPPQLPETPWKQILTQAVSPDAKARYATGADLARALEEVAFRVEGIEHEDPYPGLASFQQEDAEFFFGREAEVEAIWKKLQQSHLLGLIGPSGSGKSSFINAGLLAARPDGWCCVRMAPGTDPFTALGRSLLPELETDDEAMGYLSSLEGPEPALDVLRRQRAKHVELLVIVDQFEELFTQNPPDEQQRFAELLGRAALETDVHVLLSMRDDYLMHCRAHEALAPLFSDLTALLPPMGSALRRAVVQPALRCGYRFEDEAVVEEMLQEVTKERAALPLIAFTAAQLWERRNKETGYLTKDAYEAIGGVGGALAQHAEVTLEQIGQDGVPIVRELLRNLVTAEGTRAARDRDELLSVFDQEVPAGRGAGRSPKPSGSRSSAPEILDTLIDSRLLTTYEIPEREGRPGHQRIEIIHESLLTVWPRLVRWQMQDAEGAKLRDELRHQAELWEKKGRPEDLLWTGTAYREYQLWRDRYEGGLSDAEEHFAEAMTARAERAKRRRRVVVAGAFTVLLIVLGIIAGFWRQSEQSRRIAEAEALRAEASKLVAVARVELEGRPTAQLAYATKSLELADTAEARRFALAVLWRSPVARIAPADGLKLAFSPDGAWLATVAQPNKIISADGKISEISGRRHSRGYRGWVGFSPRSDLLLRYGPVQDEERGEAFLLERWSLPELRQLPELELPDRTYARPPSSSGWVTYEQTDAERQDLSVTLWPSPPFPDGLGDAQRVGTFEGERLKVTAFPVVDPALARFAWARGGEVLIRPLDFSTRVRDRSLGRHDSDVQKLGFSPDGTLLASIDVADQVRLWTVENHVDPLLLELTGGKNPDPLSLLQFSPDNSYLALVSRAQKAAYLWDLQTPLDGRPKMLAKKDGAEGYFGAFHPSGQWLATIHGSDVALWPMTSPYVRVLEAWEGVDFLADVAFSPDSRWLAGCAQSGLVHLWPLEADLGNDRSLPGPTCLGAAFDPTSTRLLTARAGGWITVRSLDGSDPTTLLETASGMFIAVAWDAEGRRVAAAPMLHVSAETEMVLRVWDLDSNANWELDLIDKAPGTEWNGWDGRISSLRFAPDGHLWSAGFGGIRRWDLESGEAEWIERQMAWYAIDLSHDGRFLLTAVTHMDNEDHVVASQNYYWTDLKNGNRQRLDGLPSDGTSGTIRAVALDSSGWIYVVGSSDGTVRVGRISGGEPHLLVGHQGAVNQVAISPDSQWIASRTEAEIRLWPMPDLEKPPLHTLPYDELLAKLRSLTNLRAVEDPDSTTGWKLVVAPFPGWDEVPTW